MPRLFFAIPIPIEQKQKLLASFPQKNLSGIRFTPLENLHITAHFLGATSEEKIPAIIQHAKGISGSISSFGLKFDTFKTIYQKQKPVMIWAQFEENSLFENLCLQLRAAFPTDENRKPNPHATLARIKQMKKLPFDLPVINSFSIVADQVQLFESHTLAEGSQYEIIDTWNFK